MVKMKWDNFDDDELDGVEWDPESDGGFTPYEGPIPPSNTMLRGYVKKAWATSSKKSGAPMLKILWEAANNDGEKKKYNGLPIWHYVVFTKESAFSWKPFLNAFDLTASDVKNKMVVDANDDGNNGKPITKIGTTFKPGDDGKGSSLTVITKREKYQDEDQARISKCVKAVSEGADDDDDDDVPF